jgi:hypothetical protein
MLLKDPEYLNFWNDKMFHGVGYLLTVHLTALPRLNLRQTVGIVTSTFAV